MVLWTEVTMDSSIEINPASHDFPPDDVRIKFIEEIIAIC
jgi:hypothetical protein